jgi:hypothetical protein
MLLTMGFDEPHRATRDVDLLGFGEPAQEAPLVTFRGIMAIEADDGVVFDLKGLLIEAIRQEVEYGGSKLRTTATLAGARIPITVDIRFGDAVEPGIEDIDLPVLLDMPSPHLRAYPPETVIAEKVHAMVRSLREAKLRGHQTDPVQPWHWRQRCQLLRELEGQHNQMLVAGAPPRSSARLGIVRQRWSAHAR